MGPITSDVNHGYVSQNSQHGQQFFIKKEKNLARALAMHNGLHDHTLSPPLSCHQKAMRTQER